LASSSSTSALSEGRGGHEEHWVLNEYWGGGGMRERCTRVRGGRGNKRHT
jgi:hypothetical protein